VQEIKTIDKKYYRELGKQIRQRRESLDLTIKQVAKKIGCSRSLVDHWELGFTKISPKAYSKLCEVLQISESQKIEVTIGFTK
jgi:transcriptional regulator with XRE-family HTH domain